MSQLKPIEIYTTPAGPNAFKTILMLEELNLPYKIKYLGFQDLKLPSFTSINPNGRVPAIRDPNFNDIVIWESCACNDYLVERYDVHQKLSFTDETLKWHARQWTYFQASGQGPYYGQVGWFFFLHSEDVPSAKERYFNEALRVMGVIDSALANNGTGWLVGDKCSAVDLGFFFWDYIMTETILVGKTADGTFDINKFPKYKAWYLAMKDRDAVRKVVKLRRDGLEKIGYLNPEESKRVLNGETDYDVDKL